MTSPSSHSFLPIVMENEMNVTKRDGNLETVSFDKILQRMKRIGTEAGIKVNYTSLAMKVIDQLYDGISTTKIDELTAEQCASLASIHYDYNTLAGHIVISNHQKNTIVLFSDVMEALYGYLDVHGNPSPLVSEELITVVRLHKDFLNNLCDYSRDYLIDYFGFKTLDRAYLMKIGGKSVERPQHMWLRVAIGIHGSTMDKVVETYDLMSQKYFTHATPTLFNAGTPKPQLSSCFLLAMENDSIEGIYNTLKDCALISKYAGGIGLHIHNIRATGSHIRGTNGTSNGIVPMLKVFNNTAKYVDQCVFPDTIIYTTEGPICINECVSGKTEIFNITGEIEVIENVLEHGYEGEFLEIDIDNGSKLLHITPEHPIRVGGDWVDAKDLLIGDHIVSVIPTYVKDIESITEDDCYFYGLFIRYGQVTDFGYEVHSLPDSEWDIMKLYLLNKSVEIKENYATRSMYWEPAIHLPFRRSDIYSKFGLKKINPRWLHLSLPKIRKLIDGLFSKDIISFDMIRDFSSIQYLCMRMGQIVNKDNVYSKIKLLKTDNLPQTLTQEVTGILKLHHTGILYDLQMKTVHNYLLEGGIVHNGGGRRNGSFAIYLEPWHADIDMFLQLRKNHGDEELKARDLFYALWIPDLFMERVKVNGKWTLMCPYECPGLADVYDSEFAKLYEEYEAAGKGKETVNARDLWFKMLDAQMETGMPYILYKDACNRKSNQKNVGTIKSSNLCVAPETFILTDNGHLEIRSLEGKTVNVWNGYEFSEVVVRKTGENQELIDIYTDDSLKVSCTPYHKFYIQDTYSKKSMRQVEAQNLKLGDKILKCQYPTIDGKESMLYAYTHGFFCGDGTYGNVCDDSEQVKCKYNALDGHYHCKRHLDFETEFNKGKEYLDTTHCNAICYTKKPRTYLYGEKKKLLEHMQYRTMSDHFHRMSLELPLDIPEKFFVPLNHTLKDKMDWFSGYCDADGTIAKNGTNEALQIGSFNEQFLKEIKLMLQTCGINPKIKKMRDVSQSLLPDGNGGSKYFDTKPIYRLLVNSFDLIILSNNGFSPKRLVVNKNQPQRNATQFIKISNIQQTGRIDDTYCFTEPKRHMGVFNGILTGQCSEVVQYSDATETAVCNLASIGLPTFISDGSFDYGKLHDVAKVVTKNLNKIININFYPTEKTRKSNMRHRPIGIGVQGLADVFMTLGMPFLSDEAKTMNKHIFETIYHGALEASCELAQLEGPYETFAGSPASNGQLQFDLWNVSPDSGRYDWSALKSDIQRAGLRNSLLLAPMPTASTSQILGFNECIEPITSNIYSRRTLAGEFIQANRYMMADLMTLGLWNDKIKNNIIANHGSVQQIDAIPEEIKEKYRTVWEMPMRGLIDMAADRGAYICQSQSLNLWIEDPTYSTLTSMHFYSWSKGLKTGIYYLRRRGKHQAQQFTIEPEKATLSGNQEEEICEMCSA